MEMENTEVLSPPPYPSRLPSYEEILRLPSPMPLNTRQARSNLHHGSLDILGNWEEEENWMPHTTAHYGSTMSLPAPPAYHDVIEGQSYCSSISTINEQQEQEDMEVSEDDRELQQRIERRMAAIDEEIRHRQNQGMQRRRSNVKSRAGRQRVFNIIRRFSPVRVMVYIKKQNTVHP